MKFEKREILIGAAVFIVATGLGFVAGDLFEEPDGLELYDSQFNITMNGDNRQETVEFDNKSVEIQYENWNEFRAFIDTDRNRWDLNTTSDGDRRTLEKIVVVGNDAYRFHFRYRDDPESFEGDFLQLYRIEQIQ
jgi:hypothetical protein